MIPSAFDLSSPRLAWLLELWQCSRSGYRGGILHRTWRGCSRNDSFVRPSQDHTGEVLHFRHKVLPKVWSDMWNYNLIIPAMIFENHIVGLFYFHIILFVLLKAFTLPLSLGNAVTVEPLRRAPREPYWNGAWSSRSLSGSHCLSILCKVLTKAEGSRGRRFLDDIRIQGVSSFAYFPTFKYNIDLEGSERCNDLIMCGIQDIRAMTVRHIKYGAKAEDVSTFANTFVETVERLLGDKWWGKKTLKRRARSRTADFFSDSFHILSLLYRNDKSKAAWGSFWELLSTCMARCLRNGSSPITIALVQVWWVAVWNSIRVKDSISRNCPNKIYFIFIFPPCV